jgi:hypothetical protein
MIHVISPLGEAGSKLRSVLRVLAYSGSLVAAAGLTQVAVAETGAVLGRPIVPYLLPLVAVVSAAYALRELGLVRLPIPYHNWQVPRSWLRSGFYSSAIAYGLVLGTGFATRAPFASFHMMVGLNFVLGAPIVAVVLGLAYGVSRAGGLVGYSLVVTKADSQRTLSVSRWIGSHDGYFHLMNGSILMVFSVAWIAMLYAAWAR